MAMHKKDRPMLSVTSLLYGSQLPSTTTNNNNNPLIFAQNNNNNNGGIQGNFEIDLIR